MEALKGRKAHILTALSRELDTYEAGVDDVIDEYANAAEKAQLDRHQTQDKARQDARKVAALEREVAYLRGSNQEYQDAWTQCSSLHEKHTAEQSSVDSHFIKSDFDAGMKDNEQYHELKQKYSDLEAEWVNTAAARDRLERKCRLYKEKLREWDAYTKDWQSKKGIRTARTPSSIAETEDLGSKGEAVRASSVPTPTLPTNSASPLPVPRATSVNVPFDAGGWYGSPIRSNDHEGIEVPCGHPANPRARTGSDSTESSDDHGQVPKMKDGSVKQGSRSPLPSVTSEATKGSSPVVVSVRPVKRKRGRVSSTDVIYKKSQRDEEWPGTEEKPVRIKSDQSSSSPLAAARFKVTDDHDSMDLDELGAKTPTPRKRQRVLPPSLGFSADGTFSSARSALFPLHGHAKGHTVSTEDISNEANPFLSNAGTSGPLDKEACERAGEEYTSELWMEQQAQTKRLQNHTEDAIDLPQNVSGNRKRTRAYQHNQKQHERQARADADHLENSRAATNSSRTPKDTVFGEQSLGGLPTPITALRRPDLTLDLSKRNELHRSRSVLRPTDPNNQILPRTSDSTRKRLPPPSRHDHGASAVHHLSEDGDIREKPLRQDIQEPPRVPGLERRLEGLLTKRSSEKLLPDIPWNSPTMQEKTYSRKTEGPVYDEPTSVSTSKLAIPAQRSSYASSTVTHSNQSTGSKRGQRLIDKLSSDDPRTPSAPARIPYLKPSPEKGDIRSRPLETLHRKHFKPNPAHNGGYNYAYREVVRKQADRRCLPGCIRPDCCGDRIRKMLAIGGALPFNHANVFSSSPDDPSADGAEDHRLLKEYMGDNYPQWKKLTEKQKKGEWMKAQEWNFGKTFGRHKDNGRQATPPGFWRVDMASTQEMAEDGKEADRMERERVEGMWREAMRKGGSWLFADE